MIEPQEANKDAPAELSEAEAERLLAAALVWQLEAGVDEAIGEAPIDRFALPEPPPQGERPRRRPAAPAPAAPPPPAGPEAEIATARAAAAAATDLPGLAAALAAFEGSSLKRGAKSCVFADGAPGARLMVIGEGPGRDEDRVGKPFVGRSGQLLDRMLAAIGLSRAESDPAKGVYITNVSPWRPLDNRAPDDQEAAILLPFLQRHIALARPKLLLCLGNTPAKHVMDAGKGVTKFRGSWTDYARDGLSIPALSTFHPAYLLRSPEMKRLAWRDLLALREKLDALDKEEEA